LRAFLIRVGAQDRNEIVPDMAEHIDLAFGVI
jgi:hypothetical protein